MKGGYLDLLITHNPGTMLVKGALLKDQVQNAKDGCYLKAGLALLLKK